MTVFLKNAVPLWVLLATLLASGNILAQQKAQPCSTHADLLLNEQGEPVRLKLSELKKRLIHCEVPKLPGNVDAKGTVILEVLVTPEGKVQCARVLYGLPILIKSAVEAAEKSTFKPVSKNGKPMAVLGLLQVYVSYDYREAKKQCKG